MPFLLNLKDNIKTFLIIGGIATIITLGGLFSYYKSKADKLEIEVKNKEATIQSQIEIVKIDEKVKKENEKIIKSYKISNVKNKKLLELLNKNEFKLAQDLILLQEKSKEKDKQIIELEEVIVVKENEKKQLEFNYKESRKKLQSLHQEKQDKIHNEFSVAEEEKK